MYFVYLITGLIFILWGFKIYKDKKITLKRTPVDLPLVIFLIAMTISTYFSVDKYVSIFGYPTRLNGGLLSLIGYALLYWGFVNNIKKDDLWKILKAGAVSTFIVSVYAILQKFGIDDQIWQEDVRSRVFATFGQPNWLGTWLAAALPILAVGYILVKKKYKTIVALLIILSTLALYFTQSRSAMIGLFIGLLFLKTGSNRLVKPLTLIILIGSLATFSMGSQSVESEPNYVITPSTDIRIIVWKGSLDMFAARPIFGFGPETFAYVYPQHRPAEHNTTSEWDLIYNKAHNEYLHYLATTGLVGLCCFLVVLMAFGWQFIKAYINTRPNQRIFISGLFAGWVAVLVSIFFGFTTPTSSLLVFLLPASAAVLQNSNNNSRINKLLHIPIMIAGVVFILVAISSFTADVNYQKSIILNDSGNENKALEKIKSALLLHPFSPIYLAQKAQILTDLELTAKNDFKNEIADLYDNAIRKSPHNTKLYENKAVSMLLLSNGDVAESGEIESLYLKTIKLSPTDPKQFYKYALFKQKQADTESAINLLNKSLDLKPDYKEARLALGIIYESAGSADKAKEQYLYILENINPADPDAIRFLDGLKK